MAPLSRQRLELVLAKVICKYPDEVENLLQESRKAVDVANIESEMKEIFDSKRIVMETVYSQIDHYIKIARTYSLAKDSGNAMSILETITSPLIDAIVEQKLVPDDGEEREQFDEFIVELETCWQKAIDAMDEKITSDALKRVFKELCRHRVALTPMLGPIFSDALRMVKKKILATEKR
mmetsp:Transcript_10561/g.15758  ORF Transcript_10561/g.15758 Transcript_10561/m.15758 type:complete len:179 (-) Transcript_10561:54-590(-)